MLQNEYLDAKIGFDTEENELSKVSQGSRFFSSPVLGKILKVTESFRCSSRAGELSENEIPGVDEN